MIDPPKRLNDPFAATFMADIRQITARAAHLAAAQGVPLEEGFALLTPPQDSLPTAFTPIARGAPELTKSIVVVGQALDNQWGPRGELDQMFTHGWARDEASAFEVLDRATRAELRRALINAERVVVNRAYFFNNPSIFAHFTSGSVDRDAFIGLLETGAIIPYLIKETSPDETPRGFTLHPTGLDEWQATVRETHGMTCLRLSWDDDQNDEQIAFLLAGRFHEFIRSVVDRSPKQFAADLGLDLAAMGMETWYGLAELLDESARKAGSARRRNGAAPFIAREEVYRVFVSTNPGRGLYDGGALLADDPAAALAETPLESLAETIRTVREGVDRTHLRKVARGIKELADLSYTTVLPDAIGGFALTPRDSLQRRSLQEFQVALQDARARREPIEFDQLREFVQREAFSLITEQLQPLDLEDLPLDEIRKLRETDEWRQFITNLRELIAVAPLRFRKEAAAVYRTYARALDKLPKGNIPWMPQIGVAISIAGATLNTMWADGLTIWEQDGVPDFRVNETNAPLTAQLVIGNGLPGSSWTSRLDFLSGGVANPNELFDRLVTQLAEQSGSQRGNVFWRRREATINAVAG